MQRLTLRRRHPYSTKSNKRKVIKTPGGKLVYHYVKKPRSLPKCSDCKDKLHGITASRPMERKSMKKRDLTVSRSYGGSVCHKCLQNRIILSFLVYEERLVAKKSKKMQ